jgi:hypothetical protein
MTRSTAILTLLVATSCTRTHHVTSFSPPVDRRFLVYTDSGTHAARAERSAAGLVVRTGSGQPIAWSEIRAFEEVSHGRGLLHGMGLGALIGAGTGIVVGLSSGDDECQDWCLVAFSAEEKAAYYALGLGGIGLIGGAVVGLLMGSRDRYVIDGRAPAGPAPRVTAAPLPGGGAAQLSWSF